MKITHRLAGTISHRAIVSAIALAMAVAAPMGLVPAAADETPRQETPREQSSRQESPRQATVGVRLVAESGFFAVPDHRISYGEDESTVRYHKDGGQDVLFPFARLSAELDWNERHTTIFLYQPLTLETRAEMPSGGLTVGGEELTGDTLNLLYNFPFYRISHLKEVYRGPRLRVAAGGSLQIRNATIEFEGSDGGFFRSADIGPVPLVKARARYQLPAGFWVETEVDGIYAPISYLNGSDNDTVGALLDAALRAGFSAGPRVEPSLTVRYLGGGASNEDPSNYSVNWLKTLSVSLGAALSLN